MCRGPRRATIRRIEGLFVIVVATMLAGCGPREALGRSDSTSPDGPRPSDRATEVADRYLRRHPPATWRWSWQTAILTVGVLRLDAVDDQRDWAGLLAEHYTARPAPPIRRPDDCAPALGAALLLAQGVEEARPALERVAAYVHAAPRNRLGALDHLDPGTPLGRLYPASIWIDSMVMYATTAAWVGRALGDEALLTFAHAQPAIFAAHLQDPSTGLFRHAYLHHRDRTHPLDDVFWLRGNGWAALALVELLDTMDPRGPEHLSTRTILRRLATGLHEHRRRDGTWPTVLDARRRGVRDESSGSALVAYALAKGARLGLLPAWHRDEARVTLRTLERRLRPSRDGPILTGTSTSTVPSRRAGYVAVPRRADVSYGVGAYLLLAAELRAAE